MGALATTTRGGTVDTTWFKARLEDRGISMRRAAKVMGMDVSAVSLMLNGKRRMQAPEAGVLARVLQVPVEDVLTHAGVQLPLEKRGWVPVVGWLDQGWKVHADGMRGPRKVLGPGFGVAGVCGLRVESGGAFDGWLLYYRQVDEVTIDAVGRLCVVRSELGEEVRWVHWGYQEEFWGLEEFEKSGREERKLVSASPILVFQQGP